MDSLKFDNAESGNIYIIETIIGKYRKVEYVKIDFDVLKMYGDVLYDIELTILDNLFEYRNDSTNYEKKLLDFVFMKEEELEEDICKREIKDFLSGASKLERTIYNDIYKLSDGVKIALNDIYYVFSSDDLRKNLYDLINKASKEDDAWGTFLFNEREIECYQSKYRLYQVISFIKFHDTYNNTKICSKIIGYKEKFISMGVINTESSLIYISLLDTEEEYRRMGYARKLIEYISIEYPEYAIALKVGQNSDVPLHIIYPKLGFELIGTNDGDILAIKNKDVCTSNIS